MQIKEEIARNKEKLIRSQNYLENFRNSLSKSDKSVKSYLVERIRVEYENYQYYYDIDICLNVLMRSGYPNINNLILDVHGLTKRQFEYSLDYLFYSIVEYNIKDLNLTIITGRGKGILRTFLVNNFDEYNEYYGTKLKLINISEGKYLIK